MASRKKGKNTTGRSAKRPEIKTVRQRLLDRKREGGRAAAFQKRISPDTESARAKLRAMKENGRRARFAVPKTKRRPPSKRRKTGTALPKETAGLSVVLPIEESAETEAAETENGESATPEVSVVAEVVKEDELPIEESVRTKPAEAEDGKFATPEVSVVVEVVKEDELPIEESVRTKPAEAEDRETAFAEETSVVTEAATEDVAAESETGKLPIPKGEKPLSTSHFFTPVKLLIAAVILLLLGAGGFFLNQPPEILSMTAADGYNEDHTVTVTVEVENAPFNRYFDNWCIIKENDVIPDADDTGWIVAENGICTFDLPAGDFYIFAKDAVGNISGAGKKSIEINEILAVKVLREETYLPHGGTWQLEAEVTAIGDVDRTVTWSSSDDSVASVTGDGFVTGISDGTATVTATAANGMVSSAEVVVTDCIISPSNEYKEFIPAYYYSEEEAELMDRILFSRVADAGGYGTRGAVVAAARFITLEMPYMIPYFYENGRMGAHPGRPVCDGEGRYYRAGLYFSERKFDDIIVSVAGPAIWGSPLMNFQTEGYFTSGRRYPNGLSCSGFVSWAMINGGIDTGDIGAGDYLEYSNEFSDLGERLPLTIERIRSGEIRVGDLIGKDGHIAIVVGLNDTHIWIAESYFRGVQTVRFTVERGSDGVIDCEEYNYTINMDHMYYNGDGVYTDSWE